MTTNIIEILKCAGVSLERESGKPILLFAEFIYLIKSGSVNLFYASIDDNGNIGSRKYITSFQEGDFLFPVESLIIEKEKLHLIADPLSGSVIMKIDKKIDDLLDSKELFSLVVEKLYDWITKLSSVFIKTKQPISCKTIPDKENEKRYGEIKIEAGTNFKTDHKTLWVLLKDGFCEICGNKNNVLLIGRGGFPLSPGLWLRCVENTSLVFIYPEEITDGKILLSYAKNFYSVLLRYLVFSRGCNRNIQIEQKRKLVDLEDKAMNSTLDELVSLNKELNKQVSVSPDALVSPYLAALEVIGQTLNIKFKLSGALSPGLTGRNLIRHLLERSSVYYRKIKLQNDWWKEEGMNMIVFYKDNQKPAALIYSKKRGYQIHDYKKNRLCSLTSVDATDIDDTGYVIYPQLAPKKLKLRDILPFAFMGLKSNFSMIFITGIAGGAISLAQPYITSIIFNSVIPSADFFRLYQVCVILTTAAVTSYMFSLGYSLIILRITTFSDYHLQSAVIGRLLKLPTTFFKQFSTGDLTQRVLGVETIRNILSDNVTHTIFAALFAIPNLILIFYYSWRLSLIAIVFLILFFIILASLSFINYKNLKMQFQISGELSGFVLQVLNGINKIRHSISEDRVFIKWTARFSEETRWYIRSMKNQSFILMFNSVYPILITCLFFYFVGGKWKGHLDLGEYLSFNSAFTAFMGAVVGFAGIMSSLVSLIPVYRRLSPILETLPESDINLKSPEEIDGSVELSHITYRYGKESPLVLCGINIVANPGDFVAIVGPSGAGKSTIIRLLLGFEKPEGGSIFYSRQDLSTINCRDLRKQIGVVLQSGSLIPCSIYENIAGISELSLDDAWEAAKMAGCEKDIQEMPMQMHTIVDNNTLSGGQRQRILIARALAGKPKLIIFDEATSALDNETQAHVSDSLRKLNITRIVVAHRLSTIEHADRIYVINKGIVEQQGNFKELINKPGLFELLAKRQMV